MREHFKSPALLTMLLGTTFLIANPGPAAWADDKPADQKAAPQGAQPQAGFKPVSDDMKAPNMLCGTGDLASCSESSSVNELKEIRERQRPEADAALDNAGKTLMEAQKRVNDAVCGGGNVGQAMSDLAKAMAA